LDACVERVRAAAAATLSTAPLKYSDGVARPSPPIRDHRIVFETDGSA
jgi:hypothetical protein